MKAKIVTLPGDGILKNSAVFDVRSGEKVSVAGYVVCRQAPRTAKGHVFLTMEDETGLVNIILKPEVYQRFRYPVRTEPLIVVEGIFQKRSGISNIVAQHISPLKRNGGSHDLVPKARNFC